MSPAPTVAETKRHKGRIARLAFFVARAAEQAAQQLPFVRRSKSIFIFS